MLGGALQGALAPPGAGGKRRRTGSLKPLTLQSVFESPGFVWLRRSALRLPASEGARADAYIFVVEGLRVRAGGGEKALCIWAEVFCTKLKQSFSPVAPLIPTNFYSRYELSCACTLLYKALALEMGSGLSSWLSPDAV